MIRQAGWFDFGGFRYGSGVDANGRDRAGGGGGGGGTSTPPANPAGLFTFQNVYFAPTGDPLFPGKVRTMTNLSPDDAPGTLWDSTSVDHMRVEKTGDRSYAFKFMQEGAGPRTWTYTLADSGSPVGRYTPFDGPDEPDFQAPPFVDVEAAPPPLLTAAGQSLLTAAGDVLGID